MEESQGTGKVCTTPREAEAREMQAQGLIGMQSVNGNLECPLFRDSHFYPTRAWEQGPVPELQHGFAQHCDHLSQLSSKMQFSDEKTEGHTVACHSRFSQKLFASNIVPLAQHE
ncbi:hypothetical protein STEG23_013204 [Scotinomys teguina]